MNLGLNLYKNTNKMERVPRTWFVMILITVSVFEIGSTFEVDTPDNSETEIPNHRRTSRVSKLLTSQEILEEKQEVGKRESPFDVTGATKDDIKIHDFWRNYMKIIQLNTNDNVEGLGETESISTLIMISPEGKVENVESEIVDNIDTNIETQSQPDEVVVDVEFKQESQPESNSPATDENSASRFSARSEANEDNPVKYDKANETRPYPYFVPRIQEVSGNPVRTYPALLPPRPPTGTQVPYTFQPMIYRPPTMINHNADIPYHTTFYPPMPIHPNYYPPPPFIQNQPRYTLSSPADEMKPRPGPLESYHEFPPTGYNAGQGNNADFQNSNEGHASFVGNAVSQPAYPYAVQATPAYHVGPHPLPPYHYMENKSGQP